MQQTWVGILALISGVCMIVFSGKNQEYLKLYHERLNQRFGTPLPPDGLQLGMTIAFGGLFIAIGIAVLLKALFA